MCGTLPSVQYYPAQMKHLHLDVRISAVLNRKLDALLNGVCVPVKLVLAHLPQQRAALCILYSPNPVPSGWSQCSSIGSAPLGPHLFAFLGSVKIMHVIRRKWLLSLPVGNGAR